jgi:hypothetical protein
MEPNAFPRLTPIASVDRAERRVLKLRELLALQLPEPQWLIEPWIPRDALVLVVGPPNAGKSKAALGLSRWALERGQRVFYAQEEGSRPGWKSACWRALSGLPDDAADRFASVFRPALDLCDPSDRDWLVRAVHEAGGADLVFLDSLAAVFPNADENDGVGMKRLTEHLVELQTDLGGTVVVLHHSNMAGWRRGAPPPSQADARGHGALAARVDTQLAIVPEPRVADGIAFKLWVTKQREFERARPQRLQISLPEGQPSTFEAWTADATEAKARASEEEKAEALLVDLVACVAIAGGEPVLQADLFRRVRGKQARKSRTLKLAVDRGLILRVEPPEHPGRKGPKPKAYAAPRPEGADHAA